MVQMRCLSYLKLPLHMLSQILDWQTTVRAATSTLCVFIPRLIAAHHAAFSSKDRSSGSCFCIKSSFLWNQSEGYHQRILRVLRAIIRTHVWIPTPGHLED